MGDDLLPRDVFVVRSEVFLGRRGDDGVGQAVVFLEAFGQFDSAEGSPAGLVFAPCVAREVSADDHFHFQGVATASYRNSRMGRAEDPVGQDVRGQLHETGGDAAEHLSFVRNGFGQYHVEGRDAVGGYHDQNVVVQGVHVAYFAAKERFLSREVEVGFFQSVGCHIIPDFFVPSVCVRR